MRPVVRRREVALDRRDLGLHWIDGLLDRIVDLWFEQEAPQRQRRHHQEDEGCDRPRHPGWDQRVLLEHPGDRDRGCVRAVAADIEVERPKLGLAEQDQP